MRSSTSRGTAGPPSRRRQARAWTGARRAGSPSGGVPSRGSTNASWSGSLPHGVAAQDGLEFRRRKSAAVDPGVAVDRVVDAVFVPDVDLLAEVHLRRTLRRSGGDF